jgi:eukaryotic-like serine/threonine-protein kinase
MQNPNLSVGTVVQSRYLVESLLGKGGFGAVYRVRDLHVEQNLFALKEIIDSSKEELDRFTYEGELLRRLDHPSLPRVYRVFTDSINGRAYMLMDFIAGTELKILQQQQVEGRFPLPQALSIMAPIIDAVSYLHNQHPPIVHRDIKPANIIVPSNGSEAVLVDFGIAKESGVTAWVDMW